MMRFDRSAHRAQLIVWLEKNASPKALNLAAVLETCTKQRPCRSRACPVCGEAFQQAMVAVTRKMICEPATATIRGRKSALTLIPAVGILDPEDLDTSLVSSVVEIFELSMIAAKLPICVGSLDFSFNEDQTGEHDPHWSVHGSLVCFDWLSKEQKDALRLCQGKSPNVSRPVVSVELDENEEGLQYQFKPERTRRVS